MWVFIGFVILVLLLIIFVVNSYNSLVRLQNRYENAYSQIDVQLKRRYDLIPNLVETAKGYLEHERETLESVTKARRQAVAANEEAAASPGDPRAMEKLNGAEASLTSSLGRLMMVAEDYPDLKGNEQMNNLTEELTSTENKVAFARQAYNDAVTKYNTKRETFPHVVIANSMGYSEARLFEIKVAEEREAPEVSF
jgi:LemA protein